jgi:outer membrane protein insertion porin family
MLGTLQVLLLYSCSNLRHLPENEKLYTGAKVEITSDTKIKEEKSLKTEAKKVLRPKPNSSVLGLRVKLWFYNVAGTPKGKGLRYFMKNTLGEPPVLLSAVNPAQVSDLIDTRLFNHGVFRSTTTFKVPEKKRKAWIEYIVAAHEPYKIDSIVWPDGADDLTCEIRNQSSKSKLKEGMVYELDRLEEERSRINEGLKETGYFYFDPDYILFTADTNNSKKSVTLSITIKPEIPKEATLVYRLNDIYVIPGFSLSRDSTRSLNDTLIIDNIHYIAADKSYRPKVILRSVFLNKGDIYSRTNHNMTLSRLMGMGVFKFVNVRFNGQDSVVPGLLNARIYLTPLPKKSIRSEIELVTKSTNFLGPSITLGYNNRNALNGAELLTINVHGSFETQFNGQYKGLFSYEIGPEISIYVPRFIVPFNLKNRHSYYIPKTRFTLGYDFLKRVQYYQMNSFKFIFGYKWKETLLKEHELNPVNINYVKLQNETPLFRDMLDVNPLLRRSFEEQFIAGATYSYTYNQQVLERKRNQTYFNGTVETSGNMIALAYKIAGSKSTPDNPLEIAGAIYSQYVRTDADLRHYRKLTPHSKLAGRIYAGYGYSYGNSSTLPYIKQFYSGGVSSVRAFRARSLGPGVYTRPDSSTLNFYFEQGGDIKLEANVEYRFDIISILKGALFCDAGNIWLLRPNPVLPGGVFNASTFYKELGVGAGYGIRLDANFFVLRLDVAIPLRKPWYALGDRWTFGKIKPSSSEWRSENLIFNLAIGYPF